MCFFNIVFVEVWDRFSWFLASRRHILLVFILRLRPCRRPLWQSQASWLLAWWLGNILVGLLACWVLLSGFCFAGTLRFECVLARWLLYVSFQTLFSNNCDFTSGCRYFWCPELAGGRPSACILAAWGSFWHLGGTLGNHGSSRQDCFVEFDF